MQMKIKLVINKFSTAVAAFKPVYVNLKLLYRSKAAANVKHNSGSTIRPAKINRLFLFFFFRDLRFRPINFHGVESDNCTDLPFIRCPE